MTYQTVIMTGRPAEQVVAQLIPSLQDRVPTEVIARLQQAQEPASWPATIEEAMGLPPRKRMGRPPIPLAGRLFDTLLVIEQAPSNEHGDACWRCRCQECGAERVESGQRLREGDKVFCPCTEKQPRGCGRTRKDGSWPQPRSQTEEPEQTEPNLPDIPAIHAARRGPHTKEEVIAALRAHGAHRRGHKVILGGGQPMPMRRLHSIFGRAASRWTVISALPEEVAA